MLSGSYNFPKLREKQFKTDKPDLIFDLKMKIIADKSQTLGKVGLLKFHDEDAI